MPLRYPSKTVKLPFNAAHLADETSVDAGGFLKPQRTYTTSQIEQTICGMSKHLQCSEPFYASAIRDAIQSDSASSSEEKRKMMEMLSRFERGETEGSDGSAVNGLEELLKGMGGIDEEGARPDEEREDEGFDALEALKQRLSDNADLDEMDLQDLVNLLPEEHREQFLSLVSNPDSEQVQRLLGSLEEGERKALEGGSVPWFMLPEEDDIGPVEEEGVNDDHASTQMRDSVKPQAASVSVTQGITVDPSIGLKLLYNALAICMAYVHVLMSHSLPSLGYSLGRHTPVADAHISDTETMLEEILDLIPFLGDPKSTVRYATVREVWEDVWTRIGNSEKTGAAPAKHSRHGGISLLVLTLVHVRGLLVPSLDLSKGDEHGVELALSDMYEFFSALMAHSSDKTPSAETSDGSMKRHVQSKADRRRQKALAAAGKKLAFYLAAVQAVRQQYGRKVWLELSADVGKEIERLRAELEDSAEVSEQDPFEGEKSGLEMQTMDQLAISAEGGSTSIEDKSTGSARGARIVEL